MNRQLYENVLRARKCFSFNNLLSTAGAMNKFARRMFTGTEDDYAVLGVLGTSRVFLDHDQFGRPDALFSMGPVCDVMSIVPEIKKGKMPTLTIVTWDNNKQVYSEMEFGGKLNEAAAAWVHEILDYIGPEGCYDGLIRSVYKELKEAIEMMES